MGEDELRESELPLESVGTRLRRAREQLGLGRADVASRTRIAERHLALIEADRFSELASSTYAVGFSRAYARVVGLDEQAVASDVRAVLAGTEKGGGRASIENFEPGDPARVPAARTAWVAALAALVVLGLLFVLWRSYLAPAASLPELEAEPVVVGMAPGPAASGLAPAPAGGQVVFTATQDDIWVKFYDASGAQLMQKQMALGESYAVPADADGPLVWTARPEALAITVGARPVPPLADRQMTIRDVPVSAAALLARAALPPSAPAPALSTPGAAASVPARASASQPRPSVSAGASGLRQAPAGADANLRPANERASASALPEPAGEAADEAAAPGQSSTVSE